MSDPKQLEPIPQKEEISQQNAAKGGTTGADQQAPQPASQNPDPLADFRKWRSEREAAIASSAEKIENDPDGLFKKDVSAHLALSEVQSDARENSPDGNAKYLAALAQRNQADFDLVKAMAKKLNVSEYQLENGLNENVSNLPSNNNMAVEIADKVLQDASQQADARFTAEDSPGSWKTPQASVQTSSQKLQEKQQPVAGKQ